ncbi:MAG: AEC family transporter [Bhargavaea sp.]
MEILFTILLKVIAPVFVLIGAGAMMHRIFNLNLSTLSKLLTYYFLPVVAFINVYDSQITGDMFFTIVIVQLLVAAVMAGISSGMSRLLKLDRGMDATLKNSVVLMNSGNYGVPVSQLVFQSQPVGVAVQVIVMIIQNLITYTYGLYNSLSARHGGVKAIREFLKMPVLYALLLGLVLKSLDIGLPFFIMEPIERSADAFLAVALLALGAQVAFIKIGKINKVIIASSIGRLLMGPAVSLCIIFLLGLDGIVAQALFIASSFPSSRNSAQFALEYNNYPELAGQIVLVTTALSALSVTLAVYVSKLIF